MGNQVRLGPYVLHRRLALGGMAEVYLASTMGLGGTIQLAAVKAVRPEFADDPGLVRMFLDEAKISEVLRHPNITQLLDCGSDNGTPYLVMEYVCGVNLKQVLKRGSMPLALTAEVGRRVAGGLHAAHTQTDDKGELLGIVHRDVTPHNVMLSFEGQVKLLDFGIAVARIRAEKTGTGVLKGKWAYMSPEHVMAKGVDWRSDIFSLGILLYEMVSGRRAFAGGSPSEVLGKVVYEDPAPLPKDLVPPAFAEIVLQCLQKSKEDRIQSGQLVSEALAPFAEGLNGDVGTAAISEFVLGRFSQLHSVVTGTLTQVEQEAAEALSAAPLEQDGQEEDQPLEGSTQVVSAPFEQLAGDHEGSDAFYQSDTESSRSTGGSSQNRPAGGPQAGTDPAEPPAPASPAPAPPAPASPAPASPAPAPPSDEQAFPAVSPLSQRRGQGLAEAKEWLVLRFQALLASSNLDLFITVAVGIATGLVLTMLAWFFDVF